MKHFASQSGLFVVSEIRVRRFFFIHNGFGTAVSRADTDGIFYVEHEDFAIARFPGLADAHGRFDDVIDRDFADDRFHFDMGEEIYLVFLAPVYFDVAFLCAAAIDLADRDAHDADGVQGGFEFVQLARTGHDVYLCNFSHIQSLLHWEIYL